MRGCLWTGTHIILPQMHTGYRGWSAVAQLNHLVSRLRDRMVRQCPEAYFSLFYSSLSLLTEVASPGPSRYYPRSTKSAVAHSITYRAFPTPSKYNINYITCCGVISLPFCPAEKRPGSAQYTPTTTDLPHSPQYSCRPHCLPTFPDILNYPEHGTPLPPYMVV